MSSSRLNVAPASLLLQNEPKHTNNSNNNNNNHNAKLFVNNTSSKTATNTHNANESPPPSPLSTNSHTFPKTLNTQSNSITTTTTTSLNYPQILYLEKGNGSLMANGSTSYGGASSMTDSASVGASFTGGGSTLSGPVLNGESKKMLGHREVKHGIVLYKKVPTDELKKSIQFGIVHFLNELNRNQMDRDLILQDFQVRGDLINLYKYFIYTKKRFFSNRELCHILY